MNNGRLILFGRFPPPIDGQSLATRRFASLVEKDFAITSINSNTDSSSNVFAKFRHYMSIGRELRLTTKEDPDALIVWQSISPQISGHFRDILAVVPYVRKHPTLAVVHWGSFSRLFQSPVTRLTAVLMGKIIERFVFTTDSLSNACDEWIPAGKRAVIPNTIDVDTVCTEREVGEKRDRVSSDPLRVLFLSNMIREKGYLDVLEAAALLREKGVNVAVDFVGNWSSQSDRVEFEDIVSRENLEDIVEHHGPVSDRSLVKQFHLQADVFVLPSYHIAEAQPLSIIEALNAGTPVIATRHGGIPDMVTDGEQAIFVPRSSPETICDAVSQLSDHAQWTAMSLRARKLFLEKYHPDVVRRQWVELLTKTGNPAEAEVKE